MSKLNIIDDILAPTDRIKLNYRGENPFLVVGIITGMLRDVMKISAKDILETDIRYDVSSENRSFYGVWMGKRTEDKWTKTFIRIVVQGEQNAKTKTGNFRIEIKGTVETGYSYANFFQRWFWWVYNRGFYYEQRRKYIENGKDDIYDMRDIVLSRFRINKLEQ